MPFEIVRNDITKMVVDAIVNTANPRPVIGLGTDSIIHEAAEPELLIARQAIGRIDVGCAEITPAFGLQANYVIHTVGPVWDGGSYGEEKSLRSCYDNSLKLAVENKCKSIAFPLISTGNYGFPKDKALQIAIAAFSTFLLEHEMQIYLVVFDRASFKLSEKLFQSVASYIDENYVEECEAVSYGVKENIRSYRQRRRDMEICESSAVLDELLPCAPMAASKTLSLEDMLKQADAGFTLNLKGYRTTYSCEGHIIEDDGDTKSKLLYIYFVCPNHRFETLPEGFMYPKGKRHNQIYRELLYKYVNGKMLARINGKYIPYDVKSDHQEHLEALRIWAENLPAIDIKKHPECYSEYMVTPARESFRIA